MAQELTIHNVPFNHLYADLSYNDFFRRYYPHRDGRVYAATYSFNHKWMDFWWRLEPTSTLYIDHKYASQAEAFLRRFPLFEIYSVHGLHTKAVFFERSGVLLLGSENIYEANATFFELMLETSVPEADRQQVIDLVFRRLRGRILTCRYGVNDIRIHADSSFSGGRPFLPCHKETPFWDLLGLPWLESIGHAPDTSLPPANSPPRKYHRWIYHLREYSVDGESLALAFDRGYTYCGDVDGSALRWLVGNCEIVEKRQGSGPMAVGETTMLKDRFYRYHPFAKERQSVTDYWLGPVKDRAAHVHLEESLPDEK